MNEPFREVAASVVMGELNLDEADLGRRKRIVGFEAADVARIASIRDLVASRAEHYAKVFFDHLSSIGESAGLSVQRVTRERATRLKSEHLRAMVGGEYGLAYVEQRIELASLYAVAGLQPRAFLGAFHFLLEHLGRDVMQSFERAPSDGFEAFLSLKKVAFFDIGIIVDVLMAERERVINKQQEAIRELSTPVLQVRSRLLLLPIVGAIDGPRAQLITDNLLTSIRATRAKVAVIDVTGVAAIDSHVANHLSRTVRSAKLMGTQVIVTGLSSDAARALAVLGVELSELTTLGDLQVGLEVAEQIVDRSSSTRSGSSISG